MAAITMRAAKAREAQNKGKIVWHLENGETQHRLPGLPWVSRELALTDQRLPDFPGYEPAPYLRVIATEKRWQTGPGRAGGDVLVARKYAALTPITLPSTTSTKAA